MGRRADLLRHLRRRHRQLGARRHAAAFCSEPRAAPYPAVWIAALVSGALLFAIGRPAYGALGLNVIPQAGAFARSLTLLGDYFLASAYWTLPIEIAFYGLVLLSLLIGGRPRLRAIARGLVAVATPYLVALFLQTLHVIDAPWLDLGYGLKNALLVRHGPYFALGIYIWLRKDGHRLAAADVLAIGAAMVLAGLEIVCRASELAGLVAHGAGGAPSLAFLAASACALFAVFGYAIHASVCYNERLVPPSAARKLLRSAGLTTYPFYLVHEAVGGACLVALEGVQAPYALKVACALLGAGAVAWCIATWAEPVVRRPLKALLEHALLPAGARDRA